MKDLEFPEGAVRLIAGSVGEAGDFICIAAVAVKVIGSIIACGVKGVNGTVIVSVQQADNGAVVRGNPLALVPVIVTHGNGGTHVEAKEIVYPDRYGLFKTNPVGTVSLEFRAIGIG